jgi:hypothetical protein
MSESKTTFDNVKNTLSDAYGKTTDSLSSVYNNASSTISENYNNVADSTSSVANSVYGPLNSMKESVSNTVGEFSSKSVGEASSEFLESNSLIARFSFVLIVVIIFMLLLRLGIYLIGYFSEPNKNPYIVQGLLSGSTPLQITQNPRDKASIPILRSNNQKNGIEFTWCVWLNITTITNRANTYEHIFNKGNNVYDATGIATINNGPGMYLTLRNGTDPVVHVVMNTVSTSNAIQKIDINNIPLKKWFHIILRMQNNVMNVYINGVVTHQSKFTDVPKQNYEDVFVCQKNGISTGFSGNLSDLRYYGHALNIFEITQLVSKGPNLTTSKLNSSTAVYGSSYLSSQWYTNKM